jgi:hypothetical protein
MSKNKMSVLHCDSRYVGTAFYSMLLKGRLDVTGRGGRRIRHVPDEFKETRKYGKLKEKSLLSLHGKLALEEAVGPS